jgi:uncharacterized LabA/DUF88 family protein
MSQPPLTLVQKPRNTRVFSYIDGFNLFYGITEKSRVVDRAGTLVNNHWRRHVWLDLCKLSASLLNPGQQLLHTKYFSARIKGHPDSERRQSIYLDALDSLPNLTSYFGLFQPDKRDCRHCGRAGFPNQEKKTDVNIATQMIHDAIRGNFDVALLITGDSDQVPTIEMVTRIFKKKVVVAFPPKRIGAQLQQVATASLHIGAHHFANSLLPPTIQLPSGKQLICPTEWT